MLIVKYKLFILIRSLLLNLLYRDLKYLFLFLQRATFQFSLDKYIYLPKKVKKFSVVRAPTTSKLSKEQLEIRFNKICLIFCYQKFLYFYLVKRSLVKFSLKYSFLKYQFFIKQSNGRFKKKT